MVFEAVKKNVTIPVGIKLQCDEFIEGSGMTATQASAILRALDFDFFEISGGGPPPDHKFATIRPKKDGYFYYKNVLQQFIDDKLIDKCPIIVTGGMTVENSEEALKMGAAMVGFSRQFIRDDKFLINGEKKCVHCNWCIKNFSTLEDGLICVFDHKKEKQE